MLDMLKLGWQKVATSILRVLVCRGHQALPAMTLEFGYFWSDILA